MNPRPGVQWSKTEEQNAKHDSDGEEMNIAEPSAEVLMPLAEFGSSPSMENRNKKERQRLKKKTSPKHINSGRSARHGDLRTPAKIGGDENRVCPTLRKDGRHSDRVEGNFMNCLSRRRIERSRSYKFTKRDKELLRNIRTKVDCSLANGFGGDREATMKLRVSRILDAMAYNTDCRIPEELVKSELDMLDQKERVYQGAEDGLDRMLVGPRGSMN
ncbi:hypothetical protein KEM54_003814 [Ascosphaera aggregata]|nr:hypothetical protein KEM54_003814 [Ascosphaera aggregata]